jgi:hypothetical protein
MVKKALAKIAGAASVSRHHAALDRHRPEPDLAVPNRRAVGAFLVSGRS